MTHEDPRDMDQYGDDDCAGIGAEDEAGESEGASVLPPSPLHVVSSVDPPPTVPTQLTEDERAYFYQAMDDRRIAAEAAQRGIDALQGARAAVDSYTRHLWAKYGLGDADRIEAESGAIVRATDEKS